MKYDLDDDRKKELKKVLKAFKKWDKEINNRRFTHDELFLFECFDLNPSPPVTVYMMLRIAGFLAGYELGRIESAKELANGSESV